MTALVALTAGILGVLVGGLLQQRGQRLALIRERQLAAADEFLGVASDVFISLTAAAQRLGKPQVGREREWLEGLQAATADARERGHEVTRRLARLEVIFGRNTRVAIWATQVTAYVFRMTASAAGGGQLDIDRFNEAYENATKALGAFADAAHEVVNRGVWKRSVGVINPAGIDKMIRAAGVTPAKASEATTRK